ncbi:class I adenylate-forming enzyme family protein [Nocardia sp. NPDC058114]|uniref:class I adenylate-forming enzyme family protein n=1 Tax=Nocardia sp. NPDC058114 TaxID=3346346 RepID=UPI0036D94647
MFSNLLRRAPATFGIRDEQGRWSAQDIDRRAGVVEAALTEAAVGPGDRVIAVIGRTARDVATLIGIQRRGAIVVPADEAMPLRRRQAIAQDCGARFEVSAREADLEITTLPVASPDEGGTHTDFAGSLLIYTSGSSGTPKGILCPTDSIAFAVHAISACLQYRPRDVIAQPLPLTFDYGLYQVWLAMTAGATVRLYPEGAAGPSLIGRLERDDVTVLPSMPVLSESLVRVADRRGRHLAGLRLITSTGGACSPAQVAGLRRLAPHAHVVPMYGLTECKRATISSLDPNQVDDTSSGVALPGTDIRIHAAGEDLPPDRVGEIHVGGPHVMAGYWPLTDPVLNERFYRDALGTAWVATGDSGFLDQAGNLHVEGRLDDGFKANGYRTSATEVETALRAIDGVDEGCVLPPKGDTPYTAAYAGALPENEVRARLVDLLEIAKHPTVLVALPEIPLNANGKIDKRAVALLLEGGQHR